jgi:hypothetical protein
MIDLGFNMPRCNWVDEQCGIIFATINDEIVGSSVYETRGEGLLILFSGVEKNQRHNGIFNILTSHYENMARRLNLKFVFSSVDVNNFARLEAARKTNFNPAFRFITKIL